MNHLPLLLAIAVPSSVVAGKVLVIAGIVYAVLQGLKKLFPSIGGYGAVALNVALSIAGAAIAVPADQFFSMTTLLTVISAAAAAAGIHGTLSKT